jgi:ABC-type phosphate/phosphonate transport system permease subunit
MRSTTHASRRSTGRRLSALAEKQSTLPTGATPNGQPEDPGRKSGGRARRFLFIVLAIVVGVGIYAYAFDKTGVNFDEIQDETRQASLVRILRKIAQPELLTYETVETNLDAQFMSPCPSGGFTPDEPNPSEPHTTVTPSCVEPGEDVTVEGFNLDANRGGDILFITDLGIEIRLGDFQTDESGNFSEVISTRERSSDEPQTIRAVTAVTVGSLFNWESVPTGQTDPDTGEAIHVTSPRLSNTLLDTWDKIIETVFLALIATTVGTIIAIPLSFISARNLMRDITVPLMALTSAIIFGIVGIGVGLLVLRFARGTADLLSGSTASAFVALVVAAAATVLLMKWAVPDAEEEEPSSGLRAARIAAVVAAFLSGIIALFLVSVVMTDVGTWLAPELGIFRFLGTFVASLGDILWLLVSAMIAFVTGMTFMFVGSRLGVALRKHVPQRAVAGVNLLLAAIAGAAAVVLLAQAIGWLYEITDPLKLFWMPAAVGAALGVLGALLFRRKESVGIGLSIYYASRTASNGIRAIEPLVMVIIFVVWVGLGAFAGSIALALHTAASLTKLYSEQVEGIALGPIEAIKATGATRMQTIIYGVAPQIVPPYISFTMYRWDINVRMSTIIGFAGGGGIGFLLQQNINLLNYRAAAVQMLAIAIVVASMDYISSRLRERFV